MAEFTAVALQIVSAGDTVKFSENPIKCNKGYISHREGSGLFTLRGVTTGCFARYRIQFNGNIAVPVDGTVGAIEIAIAVAGEPLGEATGITTPAAVNDYGNISVLATIDVPRGCCITVSVRNINTQAINVMNGNLEITRIA